MARKKSDAVDFGRMQWDDFASWSEGEREALWRRHGEDALARGSPGKRPPLWWRYQSPERRDRSIEQCRQLFDMGSWTMPRSRSCFPSGSMPTAWQRGQAICIAWVRANSSKVERRVRRRSCGPVYLRNSLISGIR